jgi:hypothetical protein
MQHLNHPEGRNNFIELGYVDPTILDEKEILRKFDTIHWK